MIRKLIGSNRIIEQYHKIAFNLDTVLLANFIHIKKSAKAVVDIGTGNGVLMLYIADQTKANIIGVEIQEERADLAKKNITLNSLDNRLSVITDDIKNVELKGVDYVVCNPPFFKVGELTRKHVDPAIAMARHEVTLTFEDLAKSASKMLKHGGICYIIHRPDRIGEITAILDQYDLTIKRMRFVHPYVDRRANHVLIEAKKYGEHGTILEKPFILYKAKNEYTDELKVLMED